MATTDDEGSQPANNSQAPLLKPHDAALRRVYRKIDWAVLPLMFMCYFLEFLDKVLINYANVMGLQEDLRFRPGQYQWMATALFVGMAAGQLPQAALLQRLPVSRVLGVNVFLWGVVVACTAAARDAATVIALRALLGVLEAVVAPALVLITAQWYAKRQAVPRVGLWYSGVGVGQLVGGLISWAAQQHDDGGGSSSFQSWRIMFAVAGAVNLATGLAVFFCMPRGLRAATFLTEEEKALVAEVLAADQAGNGEKVFRWSGVREAAVDAQVWLFVVFTLSTVLPSGFIASFSSVVIRSFDFSPKQSALLNMPSGAATVVAVLASTGAILYDLPRWLSVVVILIPALVGAGLMSFAKSKAAALAGVYLINFDIAPLALIFSLAAANVQGYTKRVYVTGLISFANACACIIAPQTFRPEDAPGYVPAKITVFCAIAFGIVVAVLLRVLYGVRNSRNAAARRAGLEAIARGEANAAELFNEDETDMKNAKFVYVY